MMNKEITPQLIDAFRKYMEYHNLPSWYALALDLEIAHDNLSRWRNLKVKTIKKNIWVKLEKKILPFLEEQSAIIETINPIETKLIALEKEIEKIVTEVHSTKILYQNELKKQKTTTSLKQLRLQYEKNSLIKSYDLKQGFDKNIATELAWVWGYKHCKNIGLLKYYGEAMHPTIHFGQSLIIEFFTDKISLKEILKTSSFFIISLNQGKDFIIRRLKEVDNHILICADDHENNHFPIIYNDKKCLIKGHILGAI